MVVGSCKGGSCLSKSNKNQRLREGLGPQTDSKGMVWGHSRTPREGSGPQMDFLLSHRPHTLTFPESS